MPKEQITTEVSVPPVPPRRAGVVEKAAAMLQPQTPSFAPPPSQAPSQLPVEVKVTFRLLPDQVAWLKAQIRSHRIAHPRAARLTAQEIIRMLVDHAKALDLDKLITRYRTYNSE
jgi:hypothetical protein